MSSSIKRVLVTGALGQIGTELTATLREKYGVDNVIATDCRDGSGSDVAKGGHFEILDVIDEKAISKMIADKQIDTIFHLAAILSATGEKNPSLCWEVNMQGTINILNIGVALELNRIIIPSSIAVWGPGVPLFDTPNDTVLKPTTMYGVTKVCGELIGDYYFQKYGLDVRGMRYPGIISYETSPGGGTTDYAVAIYYSAVETGHYTCFVSKDTMLPMMYMPDAIAAAINLGEADIKKLRRHSDYNIAAMSFTAEELAESIKKYIPNFTIDYAPDYRQAIADSWPRSIDDIYAREDWDWNPQWDLDSMTKDTLEKLAIRHKAGNLYR